MPYSACLLSQKVAIETIKDFASSDMATLTHYFLTFHANRAKHNELCQI